MQTSFCQSLHFHLLRSYYNKNVMIFLQKVGGVGVLKLLLLP